MAGLKHASQVQATWPWAPNAQRLTQSHAAAKPIPLPVVNCQLHNTALPPGSHAVVSGCTLAMPFLHSAGISCSLYVSNSLVGWLHFEGELLPVCRRLNCQPSCVHSSAHKIAPEQCSWPTCAAAVEQQHWQQRGEHPNSLQPGKATQAGKVELPVMDVDTISVINTIHKI